MWSQKFEYGIFLLGAIKFLFCFTWLNGICIRDFLYFCLIRWKHSERCDQPSAGNNFWATDRSTHLPCYKLIQPGLHHPSWGPAPEFTVMDYICHYQKKSENMSLWATFISTNTNILCYNGSCAWSRLAVRVIAATSCFFRCFHRWNVEKFGNESFIGFFFLFFSWEGRHGPVKIDVPWDQVWNEPNSITHSMVVPDGGKNGRKGSTTHCGGI